MNLSSAIQGETTVANRTALYRFTFPDAPVGINAPLSPLFLADLIDLPQSRSTGFAQVDPQTGRITGNGTFNPSFGIGSYHLNFCADFKGASIRDVGTYRNDTNPMASTDDSVQVGPLTVQAGAYVRFHPPDADNQILARVGVSFMSIDQACSNAETELPDFNFDGMKTSAEGAWSDKLSVISVKDGGVDPSFLTIFWSGVYRALISPQDYTGENYLWTSSEPYYDSYYCIWDSFRSIHPLITLMDQLSQSRMVRSLVDIYRHEGYLPDCRMSLDKGYTQGGSNADIVLTDSYLKGITDVDWDTAYEALVHDAETEPSNWDVEGRGGLESWRAVHYIPTNDTDVLGNGTHTRSISRTVEYAYDDFCIAEMAQMMGKTDDYNKYTNTSGYWKNMFKADQTSSINGVDTGFVGFLQPKYLNQTWGFQDPIFCSPLLNFTSCYLNPDGHETYEGSCWLYTFFVPGDMASLITTLGGPDTFTKRLDYLHESGLLYVGDEQAFLPVFQYHYSGRPALSAARSHYYIPSQFNTSVGGLAGNDDSGAMGSFIALSMMGLFPNPGQNVYMITPPYFEEVNVTNRQTGNIATIRNNNFDPSYEGIYVQSATLNGTNYTHNWIDHSFFLNGGTLELTLGATESSWGTGDEDLPPSLSTTGIHLG